MDKRYPELIKHLPRSMQILIFILVDRIDNGKNCLVVVVGPTGAGKSIAVVSLMYWIYVYKEGRNPTVKEMEQRWFFKAQKFLKRMNEKDLRKKDIALWDEAGIDISHKTHATTQNRVVGWLCQTFRNLQQIVFFTVPTMAFMDASVRKLLHYQIEMRKVLTSEGIAIAKPLEIQYNIRMDKLFYHNLAYPSDDGSGFLDEVDVMGIPRPPKDIEQRYEEISWTFKRQFNMKLQGMLEDLEKKEDYSNLSPEDAILQRCTERQKKMWECLKEGMTSTNEISNKIGIPNTTVSTNFGYMRKKGLNIDKFLKKRGFSSVSRKKEADTT